MAIKELQTRIALKYDSYAAWTTAPGKDLVLLAGELGICYIDAADQSSQVVPTVLFKVGDGNSTFEQLPWASAKAADVYTWAKASNVTVDGKTIKFISGAVDADGKKIDKVLTLNFATPEEVESKVATERARIAALEAKFNGENSVQGQLDALDGRLDAIEGDDGLIAAGDASTLATAKEDATTKANAAETAAKAYAKEYADGLATTQDARDDGQDALIAANTAAITKEASDRATAVTNAITEVKAYADTAEADAVSTAKAYTNEREVEINKAIAKAESDANTYSDGKLATAVSTQAAKDSAQDTEIGKKLDKTTFEAFNNGTSKSVSAIEADIVAKAGTAKSEAIAAAKTETESQVSALANGQVKTNKEAIAAMDAAYKAADKALDEKIDDLETRIGNVTNVMNFRGAVDAESDITDPVEGDVITIKGTGVEKVYSAGAWIEIGTASASDAAIAALQTRMTTAEGDIDKLEKADEDLVAADTAIKGRLDVIEGTGTGSIKKAQADAEATAKSYTDGRETLIRSELKTAYEAYADQAELAAIASAKTYTDGKVETLEAADSAIKSDVKTLQDLTSGYTGAGAIKTAVEAAQAQADKGVADADKAQKAADKAQGEIDALELVVGDASTGLAKTKEIADKATTDIAALTTRVGTAEGEIDALQAIVSSGDNTNAKLREDITALQTLTSDAAKGNEALHTELTRVAGVVDNATTGLAATKAIADKNKTDIGTLNGKVAAIEADYVSVKNDNLCFGSDMIIFNCGSATIVI